MGRYLVNRTIQAVFVLLFSSVIVFSLILLIPGDPVTAMLGPGSSFDPAAIAAVRARLRLDEPLWVQYASWLMHALRGDLGASVSTGQPVAEALLQRLPVTLEISFVATVVALLVSIPLGVLAAVYRNSIIDFFGSLVSVGGLAMPNFWIAILLIMGLSVQLRWLPASGFPPFGDDPVRHMLHLIMPCTVLALPMIGILTRQIRSSMLETLGQDFIRTARAKGLRPLRVIVRHGLRNALFAPLTVLGVYVTTLVGGSLIVESLFRIPGVGKLMVDAVFARDFQIVQGGALMVAVVAVTINLAVDLLYGFLDPRVSR